ncbi:MAG TPA: response regulator, partial [Dehalococcoidia bacterium]|nr:response regulator [Dehalococcoidia bacterium]
MARTKVLVVDDEIIIARELEARLRNFGYEVLEIASSGEQAISVAEQAGPDLVLMDIVLKGDMDGVEAAAEIRKRWAIPIIYLTAYNDDATLKRARVTEPFGYIVKPFSERELRANIEMALYKHQVETKLRAIEKWFATSMQHIGDGVVATDTQGTITFM